jgi:subtilisin family serine protease
MLDRFNSIYSICSTGLDVEVKAAVSIREVPLTTATPLPNNGLGMHFSRASAPLLPVDGRTQTLAVPETPSQVLGLASGFADRAWADGRETTATLDISAQAATPSLANPVSIAEISKFSSTYGYGSVDAARAIARAIGQEALVAAPNSSESWNLVSVKAPTAWANGFTGQGIVVAVVDSGVAYTHPDLDRNIWVNRDEIANNGIDDDRNGYIDDIRGWDFASNDNDPMDANGHGTHVAGIIAAENNGTGVTGVAYNAQIMPVRVLNASGQGSSTAVAAGIRYAADNGADVINLSLGGGSFSRPIQTAIEYATQLGALVVMAAGNEDQNQPTFPANLADRWGITVGAIDRTDRIASFSNLAGATPLNYVVAPGVSVNSTYLNNRYRSLSGTSMAAPHVAGVAALALSANPNLAPRDLANILIETADPNGISG